MKKLMLPLMTLVVVLLLYNTFGQPLIPGERRDTTETVDLGRQLVITLPDDRIMYTYEVYIVSDGDKVTYKGERNEFDITGSKIEYREWEE